MENEIIKRTFKDSPQSSVVHLVGAVEDDHVFAKGFTHVFRSLW